MFGSSELMLPLNERLCRLIFTGLPVRALGVRFWWWCDFGGAPLEMTAFFYSNRHDSRTEI